MNRTVVVLLGPDRSAVSGVSTHLNLLFGSSLAEEFELVHFRVGSEGHREGRLARAWRLVTSPLALFATILFRHASVVHINTSLNPKAYWRDVAYLLVARVLRARVVYQVHGGAFPHKFFAGNPWLTSFLRWTLSLPDVVVVLGQAELAAHKAFLPTQEIVALPNAIDCKEFAHIQTTVTRERDPLRLIYVGRVARDKGLYELLQGLRQSQELGVDAVLTVAGDGPDLARLQRYAVALGLQSRVTFTGAVFGADKVNLLAGSDVMVLPSYAEGLPYALLEGMAAGIPVIATPVGAIPDVVTPGTHGLLVKPRDGRGIAEAIAILAGDREKLAWMSRACRRRVQAAYAIERLAAELALRYRELAGDSFLAQAAGGAVTPAAIVPRERPQPAARVGDGEG